MNYFKIELINKKTNAVVRRDCSLGLNELKNKIDNMSNDCDVYLYDCDNKEVAYRELGRWYYIYN